LIYDYQYKLFSNYVNLSQLGTLKTYSGSQIAI